MKVLLTYARQHVHANKTFATSADTISKCSTCHAKAYVKALKRTAWALQNAAICTTKACPTFIFDRADVHFRPRHDVHFRPLMQKGQSAAPATKSKMEHKLDVQLRPLIKKGSKYCACHTSQMPDVHFRPLTDVHFRPLIDVHFRPPSRLPYVPRVWKVFTILSVGSAGVL